MPKAPDANTLAAIISDMGGTVIADSQSFQFDLPLADVQRVVPKLNEMGVKCEKVSERVEDDPARLRGQRSMVRIACFKQPQEELDRFSKVSG